MGKTRKVGLAGSLGARYGTVARRRYMEIVSQMRRPHECPQCHFKTVRRLSVGIWLCRKCGVKFAGGAYTPSTKLGEIARRATKGAVTPKAVAAELGIERPQEEIAEPAEALPSKTEPETEKEEDRKAKRRRRKAKEETPKEEQV
jgi:large subunit ribosomal protein L37Ae